MIGKVATVYELYQGEVSRPQIRINFSALVVLTHTITPSIIQDIQETDFFGMDESIIRKALGILCDEDRAVLFRGESSDEDGVKFL
jgi:hypothetical protein